MITRRTVLQAAVSLPLAHGMSGAAVFAVGAPRRRWIAIVDDRFAQSAPFAQAALMQGALLHAIRGDVTDLWLNRLSDRARARSSQLVGLTTEASLFCLDMMTRSHGMRLVYRAEHRRASAGTYEHGICGWGGEAALIALRSTAGRYMPLPMTLGPLLKEPPLARATLVSWVIAT